MTHIDEETPLLTAHAKKRPTPLPLFQFSIVLFLQLAEPLTSQVIYPFAPQLIRDLGITNGNESQVGYYVGLLQSLFFLSQAFTVLQWSRTSDRIGRKPVVLVGLLGLSISMYCFGLSKTFWGLVLSRSLCGALYGNIGVIKSIVADITDSTNTSRAYAYMPIAWSTGGSLGPIIGGSLSRPAERFPGLFGHSAFLIKYPYFLPCAVPATFSLAIWVITFFCLQETVHSPTPIAEFLGVKSKRKDSGEPPESSVNPDDASSLNTESTSISQNVDSPSASNKPLPLRAILTPRVVVAAANYASLSLVDIAFRAVQPVFLSTPIDIGGLGLPPSSIGNLLSLSGILNGLFQVFFFAQINDHFGSKKVFAFGIACALPAFSFFPLINALARLQGLSIAVWTVVGLQIIISMGINLSYGAIFIFIQNASPNRASLGATNGLSQTTVSAMRAIGPAAVNSLFSLSISKQYLGGNLVYCIVLIVVCFSLALASFLPRKPTTD